MSDAVPLSRGEKGSEFSASVKLRVFKLILVGLLTISFLFNAFIFWNELTNIFSGYGDFVIFYSGAQILKDGNGDKLYDLDLQMRYHRKLSFVDRGGILPFNHPAYQLLPMLPLAYLPYKLAYVISAIVNLLLLVLTCKLLFTFLQGEYKMLLAAVLFAFSPTMIAILNGQDSIVSAFLLTAALVSFKRNRDSTGGVCLGLGLYKPQLVLPFALLLLVKRRWASLYAFTGTGIVVVALSLAMTGWDGVVGYVNLISWMNRTHYTIYPEHMANIRGLFEVVFGLTHSTALTNLLIIAVSAPLYLWCLYLWKGNWDPNHVEFDLKYAHLMLTTLLISYHLYPYDLVLLGLALILVFGYVLSGSVQILMVRVSLLSLLTVFCLRLGLHFINEAQQVAWVSLLIFIFALVVAKEISFVNSKSDALAMS